MASIRSFTFAIIFIFSLVGVISCSSTHNERKKTPCELWIGCEGKVKVLATTAMIEDVVKRIGKDRIAVISMIQGDLDPHSYEIVKGDDEKFTHADIVFSNGLHLEHSASMQHKLKTHKNTVLLGDEILKKFPQKMIYIDRQIDPHIWMDVSLWREIVPIITSNLISIDGENASFYLENAKEALQSLDAKDAELFALYKTIPINKRYLVTSHDAFNYHVKRYFAENDEVESGLWKIRFKALQGLAPDEQINALEIKDIVSHIALHNIEVIFPEANLSQDALEKVRESCQKLGKPITLSNQTLYGDTLGGKSYFEMLDHNASIITHYLGGKDESK